MKPITLGKRLDAPGPFQVDLPRLLESRLLIQANSGGGKSYGSRRLLEVTHGKVQHIVLDPEGEFKTLREKYDYILAGEGGDIPAETRHAPLLVRKILELRTSLIVDLYELNPGERIRYVRAFLEALVNVPKKLWQPVLILLDEAHIFAPESGKGKAESLGAVVDIATRGRKRGFCIVPATTRLAKLHKDVAAECNNKLIGRTGLDTDVKRCKDELGISSFQEALKRLRLPPGNFFAFGPAFGLINVEMIRISKVATTHPEPGHRIQIKDPAPTARVLKVLARLADLPKEAEKEIQNMAQATAEIRTLKTQVRTLERKPAGASPDELRRARNEGRTMGYEEGGEDARKAITGALQPLRKQLGPVPDLILRIEEVAQPKGKQKKRANGAVQPVELPDPRKWPRRDPTPSRPIESKSLPDGLTVSKCEKAILGFLVSYPDRDFSHSQVAAMSGYSASSGSFRNALAHLTSQDLISRLTGSRVQLAADPLDLAAHVEGTAHSLQDWIAKLTKCESTIYKILLEDQVQTFSREEIAMRSNYAETSGSFRNALARLNTLALIRRHPNGEIGLNPDVRDL